MTGRLGLASAHQRFIPMAAATAVASLLISGALLALDAGRGRRVAGVASCRGRAAARGAEGSAGKGATFYMALPRGR